MVPEEAPFTCTETPGKGSPSEVTVPVTRMYAKLKVKVEMRKAEMELNNVNVRQIPNICRVETLAGDGKGEPMEPVPFPDETTFSSIAFAASDLEKNEEEE